MSQNSQETAIPESLSNSTSEFREMLKNTFFYGTSPVAASENGIKNGIFSLQYKHKFGIMLKNTLNNKIQESWISHVWLAMHG